MLPQCHSAHRPTVAYWPTPDVVGTFDKLAAVEARRKPAVPKAEPAVASARKPLFAALVGGIFGHATLNAFGGYFH